MIYGGKMVVVQHSKIRITFVLATLFLSSICLVASVHADSATINPIADAMVAKVGPDTNLGSQDVLRVSNATGSGSFGECHAYLMFDLSSVPSSATIDSATLSLYASSSTTMATETIEVHYVSDNSWTETTITWNNAPAYAATPTASVEVTTASQTYSWTITDDVKTALGSADKKLSLALVTPTTTVSGDVLFQSKENTNMPALDITYSMPSAGLSIWIYVAAIVVIIGVIAVLAFVFLRRKK